MVSDDGLTGTPLVETEGLTGQCLSLYVRENYPCNMDVVLNEQEELTCAEMCFLPPGGRKGAGGSVASQSLVSWTCATFRGP